VAHLTAMAIEHQQRSVNTRRSIAQSKSEMTHSSAAKYTDAFNISQRKQRVARCQLTDQHCAMELALLHNKPKVVPPGWQIPIVYHRHDRGAVKGRWKKLTVNKPFR
jgi:hypothetical protein